MRGLATNIICSSGDLRPEFRELRFPRLPDRPLQHLSALETTVYARPTTIYLTDCDRCPNVPGTLAAIWLRQLLPATTQHPAATGVLQPIESVCGIPHLRHVAGRAFPDAQASHRSRSARRARQRDRHQELGRRTTAARAHATVVPRAPSERAHCAPRVSLQLGCCARSSRYNLRRYASSAARSSGRG